MDQSGQLIQKYSAFGLDPTIIRQTYFATPQISRGRLLNDDNYFFEMYTNVQKNMSNQGGFYNQQTAIPNGNNAIPGVNNEQMALDQAIAASLKQNTQATYEPLDLEQKMRPDGLPVGLKNIGNTCYFNSLMQTLFRVVPFVRKVMEFKGNEVMLQKKFKEPHILKRSTESLFMVRNLKEMFTRLIASDQKYVDPSGVLSKCVNELGEQIKIGEQEDIIEFAVGFFERAEEVLSIMNDQSEFGENESTGINKLPHLNVNASRTNEDADTQSMIVESEGMAIEENKLSQSMSETIQNLSGSPNKAKTTFKFDNKGVGIFFGKSIPHLYTNDSVDRLAVENFGPIILDPHDNNLYKAWEKAMISKLEDFKNDQGQEIKDAKKIEWIAQIPGVLTFQIRRATYNVEKQKLEKFNGKFTFNENIFIDRFMFQNQKQVETIRKDVEQLEKRIDDIESQIENLNEFGSEKQNLDQSLKTCIDFVNSIATGQTQNNQCTIPQRLTTNLNSRNMNLQNLLSQMKGISSLVSEEQNYLESERNQLQDKVKMSYRTLEKNRYKLFSIIMHDGTAEYGHYYAFIKDGNKWFKFNDFHVKEISETEVFHLAYGGEGTASAYCVFYVLDGLDGQNRYHTHQLMKNSTGQGYYSLLDEKMRTKVLNENNEYQTALLKYRVDSIVSQYSKKIETLRKNKRENSEIIKASNSKTFQPTLKSITQFGDYLIQKGIYKTEVSSIFNWLVLNQVIKTCSKEKFGKEYNLSNIYENNQLYNILTQKLNSMNADMRMSDVLLDTEQDKILTNIQQEYYFRLQKLYLFSELLDTLYSCEFDKLFQIASKFLLMGKGGLMKNYQNLAGTEFTRIGIIKCFYLYIWVYKTSQQNKIEVTNQVTHLQHLVNFLKLDLINRIGYLPQIEVLCKELISVLPTNIRFLENELENIGKMYKAKHIAGEYYKSQVTNPQPLDSELVKEILDKLHNSKYSLLSEDPNVLEDEIKNKNRRCNTKANTLLKDDLPFLDLHKIFNDKNNGGLVYEAAIPNLGDLTRYYKQFDSL